MIDGERIGIKFEATPPEFERILDLFKSGELEKMLDFPVLEVREVTPLSARLRQWLEKTLAAGWQKAEELLAAPNLSPALRWKAGDTLGDVSSDNPETIASLIYLLQTSSKELILVRAADRLGEIGTGKPEAIEALTELLHVNKNEEVRCSAAISLGKIDPDNPEAAVRSAKLIDLGLPSAQVALTVAIWPEAGETIGAFVQVRPAGAGNHLPPHLEMSIFSKEGEKLAQVKARSGVGGAGIDNCIQRRFSLPVALFRVQVTLGDVSFIEEVVA